MFKAVAELLSPASLFCVWTTYIHDAANKLTKAYQEFMPSSQGFFSPPPKVCLANTKNATSCVAGKLALNSKAVCRDVVWLGHWLQDTEMSQRVFWWMLSEEKKASPAGLKQGCSPTGQFLSLSSLSSETELSHCCTALEWECNIPCQAAGLTLSLSSASPTCWNNRADPVPLQIHTEVPSPSGLSETPTPCQRMDNLNHISF